MKFSPESTASTILQSQNKTTKTRKPNIYVSDRSRLIMLILINKYDLSCYLAARVLKIPYENAKQIYRGFRKEKRIVWNTYSAFRSAEDHNMFMLSQMGQLQLEAKHILINSMKTDMFTHSQKVKIYKSNFDDFILEDALKELPYIGYSADSNITQNRVLQRVDWSVSDFVRLKITNSSADATSELNQANKEETEIMRNILFPSRKQN